MSSRAKRVEGLLQAISNQLGSLTQMLGPIIKRARSSSKVGDGGAGASKTQRNAIEGFRLLGFELELREQYAWVLSGKEGSRRLATLRSGKLIIRDGGKSVTVGIPEFLQYCCLYESWRPDYSKMPTKMASRVKKILKGHRRL